MHIWAEPENVRDKYWPRNLQLWKLREMLDKSFIKLKVSHMAEKMANYTLQGNLLGNLGQLSRTADQIGSFENNLEM